MGKSTLANNEKLLELQERYKAKFGSEPWQEIEIAGTPIKVLSDNFIMSLCSLIDYSEKRIKMHEKMLEEVLERLNK